MTKVPSPVPIRVAREVKVTQPPGCNLFAPEHSMIQRGVDVHAVTAPVLEGWAPLSDEQVVTRVLAGQTALFEVLMRRHNERIYRVARAIVRDESEAEDVMQQAYVNAYSHLRQFDGRALFSTWLTRIAVHEAFARTRRRGRFTTMDLESDSAGQFPTPTTSTPDPERLAFSRELGALRKPPSTDFPMARAKSSSSDKWTGWTRRRSPTSLGSARRW